MSAVVKPRKNGAPSKAAMARRANLMREWLSMPPHVVRWWGTEAAIEINGVVTKPESNSRVGWRADHAKRKAQHARVASALVASGRECLERRGAPAKVTLTRLASRALDDDNNVGAMKAIRDAVARWFGVDDGPKGPIRWAYAQEKRRVPGVRIHLEWTP